jgi:hypothetical protein
MDKAVLVSLCVAGALTLGGIAYLSPGLLQSVQPDLRPDYWNMTGGNGPNGGIDTDLANRAEVACDWLLPPKPTNREIPRATHEQWAAIEPRMHECFNREYWAALHSTSK